MNEWLVRTKQNNIVGPLSKEDVCSMVRDGRLGPEDEVCPANGYWIYLYERDEVKAQLGIDSPIASVISSDEEVTETETETQTQTVDADSNAPNETIIVDDSMYPVIDENDIEQVSEHTAVLSSRAMRAINAAKHSPRKSMAKVNVVGVSSPMERLAKKSSITKRFGWFLLLIAAAAAVYYLKVVKNV